MTVKADRSVGDPHVGVVTVTLRAPVAAEPVIVTVHVTLVALVAVIDAVTPVPANVTAVAPDRFVPEMTTPVSVCPWAPDAGEIPLKVAVHPPAIGVTFEVIVL